MYFKEDKRNYKENFQLSNSSKFPLWAMVLCIILIICVGLYLIKKLKFPSRQQNFGFRFY